MLDHLHRRVAETLAGTTEVTLATYGPAQLQASVVPCASLDMLLYLLVPRTSDQLFNIEHTESVVVSTSRWQLRGRGYLVAKDAVPENLAVMQLPQARWSTLVQVRPDRLQIYADGDTAETIDVARAVTDHQT